MFLQYSPQLIEKWADKYESAHIVEERVYDDRRRVVRRGPDVQVSLFLLPPGVGRWVLSGSLWTRGVGGAVFPVGRGYHRHRGPRSMLTRAKVRALSFVELFNAEMNRRKNGAG